MLLDKSGSSPVIVLADISNYPAGTAITGVFSVTQPDGISVFGNFTTPDISIGSVNITSCQKELRLAVDNNFQNGNYTVSYTVNSAGYDTTVLVRNGILTYAPIVPAITNLTDPFTPSIQVIDTANDNYSVAGFAVLSVTRSWLGTIKFVGSTAQQIQSSSVLLDLAVSGSYYDADYDISLTSIATYTNNTYAWLSVKDIFSNSIQLSVYTPPTLVQLRNSLTLMKSQIANGTYCGTYCGTCSCNGCADYTAYNTAQNIFDLFVQNGQNSQNMYSLYDSVVQMQMSFYCSGIFPQTHTYAVIPAYDWGVTSVVNVGRPPIQFTVAGSMPYAPASGQPDYLNPEMSGLLNYNIYSQANANYLKSGVDFSRNINGGWSLINGTNFNAGDEYTIIFY